MKISSGLIIADPWIGHILDGSKIWEMRSTPTSRRGWIGLIRKGTSEVHGIVRIVDCGYPLSEIEMLAAQNYHCIPEHMIRSGQVSKWVTPWKLADVFRLPKPIPYLHRSGAVTWVSFDENVQDALSHQIPQTVSIESEEVRERNLDLRPKSCDAQIILPIDVSASKTQHRTAAPALPSSSDKIIGKSVLTAGNIRNNHFYLTGFLDKFPPDTIGGSNKANKASKDITIDWGGPTLIRCDVDASKRFFRSRAWVRDFFAASDAAEHDTVIIAQVAPYAVRVRLEKQQ